VVAGERKRAEDTSQTVSALTKEGFLVDPRTQSPAITRILLLGGGFAGIYSARHLEKLFAGRTDVQITLMSRDNFLLMTPLMFEVCSGTLEMTDCSISIREFLRTASFVEATVDGIDLERRLVRISSGDGGSGEMPYDYLVLAMGGRTNTSRIPGSEFAFTFKTLADAVLLRNHLIERMERAEILSDEQARRRELTFVVIGGGLVGVELFGELTAFMDEITRYYPHIKRDEIRLHLMEATGRIMPEIPEQLAEYSTRVLSQRVGISIRTNAPVQRITPNRVHLNNGDIIEASTIVLSAGITPSPVVASLPVEKDRHGEILVDATMRCKEHPEVWAAGDCASIPDPDGKPYPTLAQHAMREAKALANNIYEAVNGRPVKPFAYKSKGIMASLGHYRGVAVVMGIQVRGFVARWLRRSYYLLVTPHMAQRARLVANWTLRLFFRPPLTKLDLNSERQMLLRYAAVEALAMKERLKVKTDIASENARREGAAE
jgi:NADH dehydrogenase